MKNDLSFCDFLNHVTFMGIKDEGEYFEITMKSIVSYKGVEKPVFKTFNDKIVDTYKYRVIFLKRDL